MPPMATSTRRDWTPPSLPLKSVSCGWTSRPRVFPAGVRMSLSSPGVWAAWTGGCRARVGTFHEASVEVVKTQSAAAHTAEEARRLIGVRPGMTLPIVHEGAAVGTVGITGSPAQARRFGLVVKRQTEILLEEAVLLRTRMTRERVLESLLRDLLTYDADVPADLPTRARDFGFDLGLPRQALVIEGLAPAGLGPAG